jgi:hypothetical protein
MLTAKEVGKITSVEAATVRNWIRVGLGKKGQKERLKAEIVKNGARDEYRIKHSDLEEFRKKFLMIKV